MPKLPPEILLKVLEASEQMNPIRARDDLPQFCLVSRDFLPVARKFLYRDVTLYLANGPRYEGHSAPLSRELFDADEDNDYCDSFGVDDPNPLPTIVANRGIGRLVKSLTITMEYPEEPGEPEWYGLELCYGKPEILKRMAAFFKEIFVACPRINAVNMLHAPDWLMLAAAAVLNRRTRPSPIEWLLLCPYDDQMAQLREEKVLPVDKPLVKMLSHTPNLEKLIVRHEIHSDQKKMWRNSRRVPFSLIHLALSTMGQYGFEYLASRSQSTLRCLILLDFRPVGILDLSSFSALSSLVLKFENNADSGPSYLPPQYLPSSSFPPALEVFAFGPVNPLHPKAPFVPPSVRCLILELNAQLDEESFDQPEGLFDSIEDTIFPSLPKLIRSLPNLRSLKLECHRDFSNLLYDPRVEMPMTELQAACAEAGVAIAYCDVRRLDSDFDSEDEDSEEGEWSTEEE